MAIWGQPSEQLQCPPEPKVLWGPFQQFKLHVFQSQFWHWFVFYGDVMLAGVHTAKWRRPMRELRCSRAAVRYSSVPRDSYLVPKPGTENNTAWDLASSALWHSPALPTNTTISPHSYLGPAAHPFSVCCHTPCYQKCGAGDSFKLYLELEEWDLPQRFRYL